MRVTDIRIALSNTSPIANPREVRLLATLSVVFDEAFVLYGIKLLYGPRGYWTAMPNIKKAAACPSCQRKQPITDFYCGHCGQRMPPRTFTSNDRLYYDVVHPTNKALRDHILDVCRDAYERELARPGSVRPLARVGDPMLSASC